MTDLSRKKLPTVEQVEEIMKEWGKYSVKEFSDRFQLDKEIIEATIEYLRKLKRTSNKRESSVMACYRNDQLDSNDFACIPNGSFICIMEGFIY